jgi:hypothetical protein
MGSVEFGGWRVDAPFYSASLRFDDGAFSLQEYATPKGPLPELAKQTPLARAIPARTWTHVEILTTFPGAGSHIVARFDGSVVLDADVQAHLYRGVPQLVAGIPSARTRATVFNVTVDNVVVTTP